jgi:hypothetical protein
MPSYRFPVSLGSLIIQFLPTKMLLSLFLHESLTFTIKSENSCPGVDGHLKEDCILYFYKNSNILQCELFQELPGPPWTHGFVLQRLPDDDDEWIITLHERILLDWCGCRINNFNSQIDSFVLSKISKIRCIEMFFD